MISKDGFELIIGGPIEDLKTKNIDMWFQKKYGNRLKIEFLKGKVVILIRGDPYILKIPYIVGDSNKDAEINLKFKIEDVLEGMTWDYFSKLEDSDRKAIAKHFFDFQHKFHRIKNTPKEIKSSLDSAINNMVGQNYNFGESKWASQMLTEKLFKKYIVESGGVPPRGRNGHNLLALAKVAQKHGFPEIPLSILETNQCSSNERYMEDRNGISVPVSLEDAVAAHHASIDIASRIIASSEVAPELRKIPSAGPERLVVSLSFGGDSRLYMAVVKFILSSGLSETIHLTKESIIWLIENLSVGLEHRKGMSLKELNEVKTKNKAIWDIFVERQEPISGSDWNVNFGEKLVVNIKCLEGTNGFGFLFAFQKGGESVYTMHSMVCLMFLRYLLELKANQEKQ